MKTIITRALIVAATVVLAVMGSVATASAANVVRPPQVAVAAP